MNFRGMEQHDCLQLKWILHRPQFTLWSKTSPPEDFKHGWKNNMAPNIATLYDGGVL